MDIDIYDFYITLPFLNSPVRLHRFAFPKQETAEPMAKQHPPLAVPHSKCHPFAFPASLQCVWLGFGFNCKVPPFCKPNAAGIEIEEQNHPPTKIKVSHCQKSSGMHKAESLNREGGEWKLH